MPSRSLNRNSLITHTHTYRRSWRQLAAVLCTRSHSVIFVWFSQWIFSAVVAAANCHNWRVTCFLPPTVNFCSRCNGACTVTASSPPTVCMYESLCVCVCVCVACMLRVIIKLDVVVVLLLLAFGESTRCPHCMQYSVYIHMYVCVCDCVRVGVGKIKACFAKTQKNNGNNNNKSKLLWNRFRLHIFVFCFFAKCVSWKAACKRIYHSVIEIVIAVNQQCWKAQWFLFNA